MIGIDAWLEKFLQALEKTFGERVWFVGLQGSYGRGDATEASDVDLVVILDELSVSDVRAYGAMLDTLPYREKACGFLSGKAEILNWEPSDLFQFCHDTRPIRGSLDGLLKKLGSDAVDRAIRTGACNLYHGCVHNMLYEKSEEILRELYKSASFLLRAVCFRRTGRYAGPERELLEALGGRERVILETFLSLKQGGTAEFEKMSGALFVWAKKWIEETGASDGLPGPSDDPG